MTGCTPEEFEADRRWLMERRDDEERRAHALAMLERITLLRAQILARTGGRGIPDELIQEALDEARDH